MITLIDLRDSLWLSAFLLAVSAAIFALFYAMSRAWFHRSDRQTKIVLSGFLVGFPLGVTGMISGFLTGSSRSPAVSALVPAILTFIGLIVVYMLGKGRLRAIIASFAVFIFALNLLVGTVLGSASRDRREEIISSADVQKLRADQEFAIRLYRKGLGLPLDIPRQAPPQPEKQ
jgi:hypothetical protein